LFVCWFSIFIFLFICFRDFPAAGGLVNEAGGFDLEIIAWPAGVLDFPFVFSSHPGEGSVFSFSSSFSFLPSFLPLVSGYFSAMFCNL